MRLPSLVVLAGLVAAAGLGMLVTEPDPASVDPAEGVERVASEAGAASDAREGSDLETRTATARPAAAETDAGAGAAEAPAPASETVAEAAPPQTCGLAAREDVVGAVVFRAGPESLIVTAADLIASTPLALEGAQWGVSIELCPEAAQEMASFSERRIGEQVQIISSGTLLSAPVLRNAIRDGRLTLTGGFDRVRAQEIADEIAGRSG